jgi:hypothetical protein
MGRQVHINSSENLSLAHPALGALQNVLPIFPSSKAETG